MKITNQMLSVIPFFLSLFNLKVENEEKLYRNLFNCDRINIVDDFLNTIGYLYAETDGKVYIQGITQYYIIFAIVKYNEKNTGCIIKYNIKSADERNELTGKCKVKIGGQKNDYIIENILSICKDGKVILRCDFNTLNNSFGVRGSIRDGLLRYKNNYLFFEKKHRSTNVVYSEDNIFYNILSANGYSDINGGYKVHKKVDKDDITTLVEYDFNKVIRDIEPDYFKLLELAKTEANEFSNNLFENIAISTLTNFSAEQFELILDISKKASENVKKLKRAKK